MDEDDIEDAWQEAQQVFDTLPENPKAAFAAALARFLNVLLQHDPHATLIDVAERYLHRINHRIRPQ